jgi:hypothetical protein
MKNLSPQRGHRKPENLMLANTPNAIQQSADGNMSLSVLNNSSMTTPNTPHAGT